jgi:hypothetical protein
MLWVYCTMLVCDRQGGYLACPAVTPRILLPCFVAFRLIVCHRIANLNMEYEEISLSYSFYLRTDSMSRHETTGLWSNIPCPGCMH